MEPLVWGPPLEDFQALASMVEKYDCCSAISLQAATWMDRLMNGKKKQGKSPGPTESVTNPPEIMGLLKLARLFNLPEQFSELSSRLALNYAGPFLELKQKQDLDGVFTDYFYSKFLLNASFNLCVNHAPSTT